MDSQFCFYFNERFPSNFLQQIAGHSQATITPHPRVSLSAPCDIENLQINFHIFLFQHTESLAGPFPSVQCFAARHSPMVFMFESQVVTLDAHIDGVGLACVTGESCAIRSRAPCRAPHHGPGMRDCNLLSFSCCVLGLIKSF